MKALFHKYKIVEEDLGLEKAAEWYGDFIYIDEKKNDWLNCVVRLSMCMIQTLYALEKDYAAQDKLSKNILIDEIIKQLEKERIK